MTAKSKGTSPTRRRTIAKRLSATAPDKRMPAIVQPSEHDSRTELDWRLPHLRQFARKHCGVSLTDPIPRRSLAVMILLDPNSFQLGNIAKKRANKKRLTHHYQPAVELALDFRRITQSMQTAHDEEMLRYTYDEVLLQNIPNNKADSLRQHAQNLRKQISGHLWHITSTVEDTARDIFLKRIESTLSDIGVPDPVTTISHHGQLNGIPLAYLMRQCLAFFRRTIKSWPEGVTVDDLLAMGAPSRSTALHYLNEQGMLKRTPAGRRPHWKK